MFIVYITLSSVFFFYMFKGRGYQLGEYVTIIYAFQMGNDCCRPNATRPTVNRVNVIPYSSKLTITIRTGNV